MEEFIISTESFALTFLKEIEIVNNSEPENSLSDDNDENEEDDENDEDYEEEEEAEVSPEEQFEAMESRIPREAVFLGSVDSEVQNWTSWTVKEEYYVIKLQEQEYDWALFRLYWDDNWESWEWSPDARIKGSITSADDAARLMLESIWSKWGIDFCTEGSPYKDILDGLSR